MIGQTVGHYQILERLGAGGMGEVYRAEDTKLKRHVALKVLPPEVAGSQQRLARFRREAEVVASLNHANIVVIHSVEEADGVHFLTMELVKGKPLHRVIPRHGLAVDDYFDVAVPLADALSVAHEQGVVHRDLKPDNVMVSDRGVVKVLDFGLAKAVTPEPSSDTTELATETLTSDGRIQGTVPYMSPEQVRGQEIDHQSDIFSLGVVLHEMATGKRLFRGESSADTVSAILTHEPEAVPDLRPDLPFHLGRIVSRCLAKDRAHRYQSTRDLYEELAGLKREVDSGRIRTGSLSKTRLEGEESKKSWLGWVVGTAVIVAAVIGLLITRPPTGGSSTAIAVMPFENLTGDPNQGYIGDGLSAGLITQLDEISGLSVVGRSETWSLRNDHHTARQIGKKLGVDLVLEGGLLPGDQLRADVTLTDAKTGRLLWSETFQGSRDEIIEIERRMTNDLTAYLAIPLSRSERRRLARDPTESARAYEFYLQGQQFLEDVDSPRSAGFARDLFRQAIRVDPEFALAHAGLSDALWRGYQLDNDAETLTEAEREAEKALEIDPELPAAQVALARAYRSTGRYAESIGHLRQILAKHPDPAEAYRQLAFSFEAAGDFDSAEENLRFALSLEVDDWHRWNSLGAFHVRRGHYPEARQEFEKAAELAPDDVTWPRENLAALHILEGEFQAAVDLFEQIEGPSDDPKLVANIGIAFFYLDRLDEAEKYFQQAVELRPQSAIEHGNLADLYLRQGREEQARESYRTALRLVEESLKGVPNDYDLMVSRALYAAKVDECEKAVRVADSLQAELPEVGEYHYIRAMAYSLCDQRSGMLEAVGRAVTLGISPELIQEEDEFFAYRSDPDFIEIVGSGD